MTSHLGFEKLGGCGATNKDKTHLGERSWGREEKYQLSLRHER